MHKGPSRLAAILFVVVVGASCGSAPNGAVSDSTASASSGTSSTETTRTPVGASTTGPIATSSSVPAQRPSSGAVDPNAPEVVEPGDIPDNQVFVVHRATDGSFSVRVPEGWARSDQLDGVVYTDKYNAISITSKPAQGLPTPASVRTAGLADVSGDPTFRLVGVRSIMRPAGAGIVATYEMGSAPNPVTGKKALLAVERYVFVRGGTEVVLTLSGAKGADNVDPWKTVTESLTWR